MSSVSRCMAIPRWPAHSKSGSPARRLNSRLNTAPALSLSAMMAACAEIAVSPACSIGGGLHEGNGTFDAWIETDHQTDVRGLADIGSGGRRAVTIRDIRGRDGWLRRPHIRGHRPGPGRTGHHPHQHAWEPPLHLPLGHHSYPT